MTAPPPPDTAGTPSHAARTARWRALWLGVPAAVALLLCHPALSGNVPFPTEILTQTAPWSGVLPPPAQAPDFTRVDSLIQYAAWALPVAERLRAGEVPLWEPNLFLGLPAYVGPGPYFPPFFPVSYLLARLCAPVTALTWQPIVLLYVAGVAMGGFLRRVGLGPAAALFGAVAWMCATSMHTWFAIPIFLLGLWGIPALCWCATNLVESPGGASTAATATVLALLLLSGSTNVLILAVVVASAWGTTCLVTRGSGGRSLPAVSLSTAGAVILGGAAGAVGWMPLLDMVPLMERPTTLPWDQLFMGRAPVAALATFVLPEYLGGTWSHHTLLRSSVAEVVHGIGAVGLVAAVFARGSAHRPLARLAGGVVIIGALGALGTPVARVLTVLPGFGTSVLPRMFQGVEWALAVLAAVGVEQLLGRDARQAGRYLAVAAVGAAAVAGVLLLAGLAMANALPPDQRRVLDAALLSKHFALTAPWWRPTAVGLFLVLCGGLALRRWPRRWVVVAALTLGLMVERGWNISHMTPWRSASTLYPPAPELGQFATAVPPVRVINPTGLVNVLLPLHVPSSDGYHPFVLRSYLDLLHLDGKTEGVRYHYVRFPFSSRPLANLLGVGAILVPPGGRPPAPFVPHRSLPGLGINPGTWPRALIIPEAVAAETDARAGELMRADPGTWRSRAVVTGPLPPGSRGGQGTARVVRYEPERVTVEVVADGPAFLLLSDQYFPGWTATINGAPVDVLCAFLALRLVPVGPGKQIVDFRFRPPVLRRAAFWSVCGIAGTLLLGAAAAWRTRRATAAQPVPAAGAGDP